MVVPQQVSIHAPRMRGDSTTSTARFWTTGFNPRPSHEGRLIGVTPHGHALLVSIHAPRMRGDRRIRDLKRRGRVSIHAPRMRGDLRHRAHQRIHGVSIHAPRMRGDTSGWVFRAFRTGFNPRPSHEGRLVDDRVVVVIVVVSIHAPRMRGDPVERDHQELADVSIHAPRMRGDFAALEVKHSV